ncbi:MAG: hypothetical protein LBH92_04350 [Bacteroidales bacterium]|jgi:hypothetical protein|nr:hypothetical protein [Bacteroidales bacterium]
MLKKISLIIGLMFLSLVIFGQAQMNVSFEDNALFDSENYFNGKIVIVWELNNNSIIINEISIENAKECDIFKIHFPSTEMEVDMVVNTNVTLSFLDYSLTEDETFPGFVEFLQCKRIDEKKWIIWK